MAFVVAEVEFCRCLECRTIFNPHPPARESLRGLYRGRDYFVKGQAGEERELPLGYAGDYLADRKHSELKFDRVLSHLERYVAPGRLLDVGSGPGFLINAAVARGWDAIGIDVNPWAAQYAREQFDVEVRAKDLPDAGFTEGEFDAVTMMDMLEHVPDPDLVMAEVSKIVRPGGALAILTPDAGSPLSQLLGKRWPEVRRAEEHVIVYSASGLGALLQRAGFAAYGWHSIGKIASVSTLAGDVQSVSPPLLAPLGRWTAGNAVGRRIVEFDPRTKVCLYARRMEGKRRPPPRHRPVRIPRDPRRLASVETAIVEELSALARSKRYCDWMFAQFGDLVRGTVAEVGAGIGTFSERILNGGAQSLLAIEPDQECAGFLKRRFAGDSRVSISDDSLPEAPALVEGRFDLVVCQNVLEHIGDDLAALRAMTTALRPDGDLALIVPAHSRLYGPLDDAYGHWRRYDADDLRRLVADSGLELRSMRTINVLGVTGWWLKNLRSAARIGPAAFSAFDAVVPLWRNMEQLMPRDWGLSLAVVASRRRIRS